jgi:hypothetical protein
MKKFVIANFFIFCFATLMTSTATIGEEVVRIHNRLPDGIRLWIWPASVGKWMKDPPYINKGQDEDIILIDLGRHEFVAKDNSKREWHYRLNSLEDIFKDTDVKELFLGTEKRTYQGVYSEAVPYTESVEQTYTVEVPVEKSRTVIRNGMTIEEKYTAMEFQTRTKLVPLTTIRTQKGTREVKKDVPVLSVRRNGELKVVPGAFVKRKIGIRFITIPDGIEITSVASGGPATTCRDNQGRTFAIKPGDQILSIDGVIPKDANQVVELIGESITDVAIEVRDKDNGTIRKLFVTPR